MHISFLDNYSIDEERSAHQVRRLAQDTALAFDGSNRAEKLSVQRLVKYLRA
jgi:hypothetical protein